LTSKRGTLSAKEIADSQAWGLMLAETSIEDIFPGISNYIPIERINRISRAVSALLNRTLKFMDDGLPFIITGDIPAMWLRDSTWQVKPLLASRNNEIQELLWKLSKSQIKLFNIDPYANAFNIEANGNCWHKDFPDQSPWVFERKYELDSWASVLYLARKIYEIHGISNHLDANFYSAISRMLILARVEQRHDRNSYKFYRNNGIAHDSLSENGLGAPVNYTGMVYSAFRPSDDACQFGYLVPSNLFFANELKNLPRTLPEELMNEANLISNEIFEGINSFAIKDGVFAYEVDGFGAQSFMDDANVPSLLSLPYLEVLSPDDATYLKTKSFLLSDENPYYFQSNEISGIGSLHTPKEHIWPIAVAIEGLVSSNESEMLSKIELLERNDAGTRQMHESFDVRNPDKFTREWFSWADMTYVDLVLNYYKVKL
jgi:meiotically up-regulated gene 157 (Mug157) protein